MKNKELTKLALLGVSAGLMLGGCQQNNTETKQSANGAKNRNGNGTKDEQMSPDMKAFYGSLSKEGKKQFNELDAQHRMMAVEMMNSSCKGQNKCAGLGGCKTAKNSCAGQNACKGKGGPPLKDANKAVDAQYSNQMEEMN